MQILAAPAVIALAIVEYTIPPTGSPESMIASGYAIATVPAVAQSGVVPLLTYTVFDAPIGLLLKVLGADAYNVSPVANEL